MRSTMPGRLSSSHDLSIGRSISRTRSSSVRAFCTSTVWASALKAESTAAEVVRRHQRRSTCWAAAQPAADAAPRPCAAPRARAAPAAAGASVKTTSGWPSMVWKLGGSSCAGCRHLLGQVENIVRRLRRGRCRGPAEHGIDIAAGPSRWRRRLDGMRLRPAGGGGGTDARRQAAGRGGGGSRRQRGLAARLGGVVVGDDTANGGENFLHRRLLRLRRLAHCRIPTTIPQAARRRSNPRAAANHPHTRYLLGSPQVWHGNARTQSQPCG